MGEIISIFHGYMMWIEKSVTNIADRHHKACRINLFHIVFAHACIGHMTRYFSIIDETLQRWRKRILSHWHYLYN